MGHGGHWEAVEKDYQKVNSCSSAPREDWVYPKLHVRPSTSLLALVILAPFKAPKRLHSYLSIVYSEYDVFFRTLLSLIFTVCCGTLRRKSPKRVSVSEV
jgi:hypothetical protein